MLQGSHKLFTFEGEPEKGHTTPPDTIPSEACDTMRSNVLQEKTEMTQPM